jgi:hypothetical protein
LDSNRFEQLKTIDMKTFWIVGGALALGSLVGIAFQPGYKHLVTFMGGWGWTIVGLGILVGLAVIGIVNLFKK